MTDKRHLEATLKVVQGALAEVGVDPSAARLVGGVILFDPNRVDLDTAWRAAIISTPVADSLPCCKTCFAQGAEMSTTCHADEMFLEDCGRGR